MRDRLDGPQDLAQPVVQIGDESKRVPAKYNGSCSATAARAQFRLGNPVDGVVMGGL